MKKISNAASSISINSPIPTNLAGECKKAAKILNSFIDPGQGLDKVIPSSILDKAQGLAIFTVIKAGFLFSGRAGSGLVVARLPDQSWSAPSAIGTGGMGAGGQIGAEITDFVLVLNTKEAVKTFSQFGNITLGGNVSIAAGPIGRNAEASGSASLKHISAVYSYSKTKGFFAGVSLEGSVILTRNDANEKFYGRRVTAKELLNGSVTPPPEADALYRALNAKFHTLGNTGAMYQRNSGEDSPRSATFKSTNISAPGTLKQPPSRLPPGPPAAPGGYNAPGGYGNTGSNPGGYGAPTTYGANSYNYGGQPAAPPPYVNSTPSATESQDFKSHSNYGYNSQSYGGAADAQQYNSAPQETPAVRQPPPPPPIRKPSEPTARALYDFNGEQQGDLSFREGEIITIVQKSESQDDWWTGKIGTRQGVFPANYVELQ